MSVCVSVTLVISFSYRSAPSVKRSKPLETLSFIKLLEPSEKIYLLTLKKGYAVSSLQIP
jgi:hypothetical protein